MDTMAVEQYAVDTVRDCIHYSDHLPPLSRIMTKNPLRMGIYTFMEAKKQGVSEGYISQSHMQESSDRS